VPDKPASERTERPTSKKLSKAKSKGQTPQSQELMSFVSIVVLVAMVALLATGLTRWFIVQLKQGMSCETSVFANNKAFINFVNAKITDFIVVIIPICTALYIGAVVGSVVVGGLNYSPGAIKLNFSILNPVGGLGKLLNMRSMVRLLSSILKLLFISIIAWFYLKDKLEVLATLRWAWSLQILAVIAKLILGLCIRVCIALLVLGVADTVFQKWKYIQDLKMTKQEVKEERRQTEGAPEVKSRIRRIQLQMAMKRMLQEVPKASVVLTNPTHVAVALRWDPAAKRPQADKHQKTRSGVREPEAPVLVAKGADHLAEKIREIARAYGVPIVRKPELARTIYSTVELDSPIPSTLYVVVAEVLALVYRLRHRR